MTAGQKDSRATFPTQEGGGLERRLYGVRLRLATGDITRIRCDAIVNAANPGLRGGGGVDGAIHRAGGPSILAECRRIVAERGPLPTGEAVLTGGGALPASYVIHTVGPVWQGGHRQESALLRKAYQNSLRLACQHNLHSVAFPSISTGAYGYPVRQAAEVALRAIVDFLRENPGCLDEVWMVLYTPEDRRVYEEAWKQIVQAEPQ